MFEDIGVRGMHKKFYITGKSWTIDIESARYDSDSIYMLLGNHPRTCRIGCHAPCDA